MYNCKLSIFEDVCNVFTHAPSERSVGLQKDFFSFSFSSSSSSTPPTFCSYPAEKSSSFVPTRLRKAQVFVSLRYRKRRGGGGVGLWLCMPSCFLTIYFCNKGVIQANPPLSQLWTKTTLLYFL